MGVAAATTEAAMSAIQESLVQLRVSLTRIAARQEQMLVTLKNTTAALTPTATATSTFVPGRVPEQWRIKPSSPQLLSSVQVVGSRALHVDAVVTPTMPTRCSTLDSDVNIGNNPAMLAFQTGGMTHLPAPTMTVTVDRGLNCVGGTGTNSPAGCSTHVITSPLEGFVDGAHAVNTRQPPNNSFPRFDGTNPRLWREKCVEFFTKFNICKPFWTTAARMHMNGKAKEWFEAYRLRQVVGAWHEFIDDVEAHFGVEDPPPAKTILGVAHPSVDVHGSGDISSNVMHTTVESTEPTAADYEEVLTHVGGLSMFLEPCIDTAEVVFPELHHMEHKGEVFTTVGDLSKFLEIDIGPGEEVLYKDMMPDGDIGDSVLTNVGGLSLFLEQPMDSLEEPKGAADASIGLSHAANGAQMVYLIMPLEDVKSSGSRIIPWDPGTPDSLSGIAFATTYMMLHCHTKQATPLSSEQQKRGDSYIVEEPQDSHNFCGIIEESKLLMECNQDILFAARHVCDNLPPWSRNAFSPGHSATHGYHLLLGSTQIWRKSAFSAPGNKEQQKIICMIRQRSLQAISNDDILAAPSTLQKKNNYEELWEPWDPGKQEVVIKGLFGLQPHAETCVSQCTFCVISRSRKVTKRMQLATDRLLNKRPSWSRSGFSPRYYLQPHLGIMPSSNREVCPACLPIILVKLDTCSVERLALYKCNLNVAKAAVCTLLNLTLGDVFCLIWKSFSLAVSPVEMFQKICKGSLCMLEGTSQWMVPAMHVLTYLFPVEVQATYPSAHIVLVDLSLVDGSTVVEPRELFQCANWQYPIGQWNLFFQGELVHRILQDSCTRCYFYLQSRLFGFNIHHLCNMSAHEGIPWDPGGIHRSRIRAIAWGQAMFCRGGSVTPDVHPALGFGCWWRSWTWPSWSTLRVMKINGTRGQGRRDRTETGN